ncbi:hypothetical protein ACVMB2_001471 [Sinorhizobium meliloti]
MDVGEVVEKQRIGPAQLDIDRMVVHLLGGLVGRQVAAKRRNRIADALQGCEHVVGSEFRAIVEFHTLTQVKAPDCVGNSFPGFGKGRFDLQIGVVAHQSFIDMIEKGQRIAVAIGIGIKRVDIARRSPFQRFGVAGQGQAHQHRGRKAKFLHHKFAPLLEICASFFGGLLSCTAASVAGCGILKRLRRMGAHRGWV